MKNKLRNGRMFSSIILSAAIFGMVLLPAVQAAPVPSANPNHGTIFNFPAIPDYQNFSSNLTVSGADSGTPTWSYAPASGSPICANYVRVTFGNINAWNTTATFDDHAGASCDPVTINLTVTSTTGAHGTTGVSVTYAYCRRCL